jgi:predicted amidophosphoribosyltransferase
VGDEWYLGRAMSYDYERFSCEKCLMVWNFDSPYCPRCGYHFVFDKENPHHQNRVKKISEKND